MTHSVRDSSSAPWRLPAGTVGVVMYGSWFEGVGGKLAKARQIRIVPVARREFSARYIPFPPAFLRPEKEIHHNPVQNQRSEIQSLVRRVVRYEAHLPDHVHETVKDRGGYESPARRVAHGIQLSPMLEKVHGGRNSPYDCQHGK